VKTRLRALRTSLSTKYFHSFKGIGGKSMKNNNTKQYMCILKAFIENNIPAFIKEQRIGDWDLMECYEELFNYSQSLLDGHAIDIDNNSFGTGRAFVFDKEYKDILLDLSHNNDDVDLRIHCYLSLAALLVLHKHANLN
jgi:hypothetical protein